MKGTAAPPGPETARPAVGPYGRLVKDRRCIRFDDM
jgi:hypothetical protein